VSLEPGAPLRLEREESGLAVLTLDSPPLNLFDQGMIGALQAAIAEVAATPPRALLIRAEGTPPPPASTSTCSTASPPSRAAPSGTSCWG